MTVMGAILRQSYIEKIEHYFGKDTIIILTGQRRVGVPPAPQVRGNIKTANERFAIRTDAGGTPKPQPLALDIQLHY